MSNYKKKNICSVKTIRYLEKNIDMSHVDKKDYVLRWVCRTWNQVLADFFLNSLEIHNWNNFALQWATKTNDFKMVKYIVARGVKIHTLVLRWAIENNSLEIIKFLVNKDVIIDYDSLIAAYGRGCIEVVKVLASSKDFKYLFDVLNWGCIYGIFEIVELCVKNNVDLHYKNNYTICEAEKNNHLYIVKYLIIKGADVSALSIGTIIILSEDDDFISDIINEGCRIDMTKNNKIVGKVRKVFKIKLDLILEKYLLLISNIREKIIYTYI